LFRKKGQIPFTKKYFDDILYFERGVYRMSNLEDFKVWGV